MTNTTITTTARFIQQIPEFEGSLPAGILNKTCTNVGGSHTALVNSEPYIIAVPTKNLIANKLQKHSNICAIYGDVSDKEKVLRNYLTGFKAPTPFEQLALFSDMFLAEAPKIITTYDSLVRVLDILGDKAKDFNLLCDEYHSLFTECSYRMRAILNVLKNASRCKKVTYMSASPIEEDFLPKELASLPRTTINWVNQTPYKIESIKSYHPIKSLIAIINLMLEGSYTFEGKPVKELFVFLNSVNTIRKVIKTCSLTDETTKVVVSNSELNQIKLQGITISDADGDNKLINFFTSTAFAGIDLKSTAGLIVVVSDQNNKQTLLDVSTHIYQIAGRIRNDDNLFYKDIIHIYQPSKTSKKNSATKQWEPLDLDLLYAQRLKDIDDIASNTRGFVIADNQLNSTAKRVKAKLYSNNSADRDHFVYFDYATEEFEYLEIKESLARYLAKIEHHIYKNGFNLVNAYVDAGFDLKASHYDAKSKEIELELVSSVNFRSLAEKYIKLRDEKDDLSAEKISKQYPILQKAYDLLGASVIRSCKFNTDKLNEHLTVKSYDFAEYVRAELKSMGTVTGKGYSAAGIKQLLTDVYEKIGLKSVKPTAKAILSLCSKVTEKKTNTGYIYIIEEF